MFDGGRSTFLWEGSGKCLTNAALMIPVESGEETLHMRCGSENNEHVEDLVRAALDIESARRKALGYLRL
jgi:hypothetical protein